MSESSSLNDQIVDSVAGMAFLNIGSAPAGTQALLDAVMSETLGMAMHNAVMRQQANSVVSSAAATATCARILQSSNGEPPPFVPPGFYPGPGPVIPPLETYDDLEASIVIAKASAKANDAVTDLEVQAQSSRAEATTAQSALDALNAKLNSLMGKRPNA